LIYISLIEDHAYANLLSQSIQYTIVSSSCLILHLNIGDGESAQHDERRGILGRGSISFILMDRSSCSQPTHLLIVHACPSKVLHAIVKLAKQHEAKMALAE
jgi:hypothetical protein